MGGLRIVSAVHARGPAAAATGDRAWIRGMLALESALATASAEAGVVPEPHAARIAAACDRLAADLAPEAVGRDAGEIGNPAGPLVVALREAVAAEDPAAAADVHRGATSQDVVDTAAMLVARDALTGVLDELVAAADLAAGLARTHRDDPVAGRTLLQQATPTTFGATCAAWCAGLDAAASDVRAVRAALPVQLGGPTGTLAGLGEAGPAVLAGVARRLDLAEPSIAWHTTRTPLARIAGALGTTSSTVGTIARDVTLLAQGEVAEAWEEAPGRGGSTSMAHKRNPVAAVCALGAASRTPGLVATLLAAGVQEHQRAAGAWHGEWEALDDLLRTAGSATSWLRESLRTVVVDAERMRERAAGVGGDVGAAAAFVDRVLAARTSAPAGEHDAP